MMRKARLMDWWELTLDYTPKVCFLGALAVVLITVSCLIKVHQEKKYQEQLQSALRQKVMGAFQHQLVLERKAEELERRIQQASK